MSQEPPMMLPLWLPLIAEEASEIAKDAMKALRFGIDTKYKDYPTNFESLLQEIADLLAVLEACGIDISLLGDKIVKKHQQLDKYGPFAVPSPYLVS